ncbi:uncharacterized protein G2W53_020390 [Senna tora]|uniref:Uncharacterized protein n=1 Tax=Senna tora TaxID=362788 RepID=A0A834TZM2_9FABA|nr:uncharacterized protein G2W53_020390 [Senna tora]
MVAAKPQNVRQIRKASSDSDHHKARAGFGYLCKNSHSHHKATKANYKIN